MVIDYALVSKQTRVWAQQKISERSYGTASFPHLTTTKGFLEVGDSPPEWQGQHPVLQSVASAAVGRAGPSLRDRLTLSKEDWLQKNIDYYESEVAKAKEEKEKGPSVVAKKKESKVPLWFEQAPAIGGGWLKASTRPPEGETRIDVLLVREATVVDKISTTIKRLCDWKLGEYKGGGQGSTGAWGVGGNNGLYDVFRDNMEIGDCILLQVEPKADTEIPATTGATFIQEHPRHIDLELVQKQVGVLALQKVAEGKFNGVSFPRITDTKKITDGFQVGDKPWEKNPEVDTSYFEESEKTFRDSNRLRVLGTTQDQVDARIQRLQKALDGLIEMRDVPGKREEILDQERERLAKHPKWDEAAVAIGGAWIKATTWPPDGNRKLQVMKVRNGEIIEIVSTTIAQYCRLSYDQQTGAFKGGMLPTGPGWRVGIDMMTSRDIFEQPTDIGDAFVLCVEPIEYHGELVF